MAFSEEVFIRLVADAKQFMDGFKTASRGVEEFQTKVKSSEDAISRETMTIKELETEAKKIETLRSEFMNAGDIDKARQLSGELERINTLIATKQKSDYGMNLSGIEKEIQQLEQLRTAQANAGDWKGIQDTNRQVGFLRAQLDTVNTTGLQQGKKDWEEYAKSAGIATGNIGNGITDNIGIMNVLQGALLKIASAMLAAFSVHEIISFAQEGMKAADQMLQAEARMEQAFGSKFAVERMRAYAEELTKIPRITLVAAEDAMAFAAAQGRSEEMTKKMVAAAIDLSAVTGRDLHMTMMQLDMTMEGNLGRMGRLDGRLKDLTAEELRNGVAIDMLGEKYKGMAERMGQVGEGTMVQAEKKLHLIQKAMGEGIITSEAYQGAWRGINNLLDMFVPKAKRESDILQEEQVHLNALVQTLLSQQLPREKQAEVMDEITAIYPGLLNGIDKENISLPTLIKNLDAYNTTMVKAIAIQIQKQKVTDIEAEYMKAQDAMVRKQVEIREKFTGIFGLGKPIEQILQVKLNQGVFSEQLRTIYFDAEKASEYVAGTLPAKQVTELVKQYGQAGAKELGRNWEQIKGNMAQFVGDARVLQQKLNQNIKLELTPSVAAPEFKTENQADYWEKQTKKAQEGMVVQFSILDQVIQNMGNALDEITKGKDVSVELVDKKKLDDQVTALETAISTFEVRAKRISELSSMSTRTAKQDIELEKTKIAQEEILKKFGVQSIESLREMYSEKKKYADSVSNSLKADKETVTVWEELDKKIKTAQATYETLLKTKGIENEQTLTALNQLKILEDQKKSWEDVTNYVKKYGKEQYDVAQLINETLDETIAKSPELKDLKVAINFDWTDPKSFEALKVAIDKQIVKIQEDNNYIIPVDLEPKYDQWVSLRYQVSTFVDQFSQILEKDTSKVKKNSQEIEDEMFKLALKRAVYLKNMSLPMDEMQLKLQVMADTLGKNITPAEISGSELVKVIYTNEDENNIREYFDKFGKQFKSAWKITQGIIATMAHIDLEPPKPPDKNKNWIMGALGIEPKDEEKVQKALDRTMGAVNQLVQSQIAAADEEIAAQDKKVSEQEKVVATEQSLMEQGKANNLTVEKEKLAALKKQRDKAEEEKKEWSRRQMEIDALTQFSSLVTAAAEIFSGEGSKGLAGVIIAIGAVAAMFSTFLAFKSKAKQMREGGSEKITDGNYHENGGRMVAPGLEAEKGESLHILRRERVSEYYDVIADLVEQANSGQLKTDRLAQFLSKEDRRATMTRYYTREAYKDTVKEVVGEVAREKVYELINSLESKEAREVLQSREEYFKGLLINGETRQDRETLETNVLKKERVFEMAIEELRKTGVISDKFAASGFQNTEAIKYISPIMPPNRTAIITPQAIQEDNKGQRAENGPREVSMREIKEVREILSELRQMRQRPQYFDTPEATIIRTGNTTKIIRKQ